MTDPSPTPINELAQTSSCLMDRDTGAEEQGPQ